MGPLLNSPAALLLAVGSLIGCYFPLAKLAAAAGVPPLAWAAVISGGAAVALGVGMVAAALFAPRGAGPAPAGAPIGAHHARYFIVTALLSFALPNALVVVLIPRLGSGYTAILYTLSPMVTVVLSALFGMVRPPRLELVGITIGFAGALLVASARGEAGREVAPAWIVLGFVVPLALACGNVYRTKDWPPGAPALTLAVGSNAVAATMLVLMGLLAHDVAAALAALMRVPGLVLAQVTVSAAMQALFFRLQAVGGPVTLSQIGTVAAAVGVLIGTLFFAERYAAAVWAGVAMIALGIVCTVRAKLRAKLRA